MFSPVGSHTSLRCQIVWYNKGPLQYRKSKNLYLKSHEILYILSITLGSETLKFCMDHGSETAVLRANFQIKKYVN